MLKEKLSYIKYIYEPIPHKYMKSKSFFVYKKDNNYFYGPSFETLEKVSSIDELLQKLEHFDLDILENYVDDIILNHCVYMKQSLAKAMQFVTNDQILQKEESLKVFFETMKNAIEKELNPNKPKSFTLIKD